MLFLPPNQQRQSTEGRHVRLSEIENLTLCQVLGTSMHQHAKFHKYQTNCCFDMIFFVIFKMAAVSILDFQEFEILTVVL